MLGDTRDDGPQWRQTWKAREKARETSGSIDREQQLLDEHCAELNYGPFRNEADKAAKLKRVPRAARREDARMMPGYHDPDEPPYGWGDAFVAVIILGIIVWVFA